MISDPGAYHPDLVCARKHVSLPEKAVCFEITLTRATWKEGSQEWLAKPMKIVLGHSLTSLLSLDCVHVDVSSTWQTLCLLSKEHLSI